MLLTAFFPKLKSIRSKSRLTVGLSFLFLSNVASSFSPVYGEDIPETIKFGIRTLVPPIGQKVNSNWQGFCGDFSRQLQQELEREYQNPNIQVQNFRVVNPELAGHDRYFSLKHPDPEERHDIQCGPNSWQDVGPNSEILFAGSPQELFFHKTGIKFLMKKSTFDEYGFDNKRLYDVLDQLRDIEIAAKSGTTTQKNLSNGGFNVFPKASRVQSLDALANDDVDAYASDGIIIRALLENGIEAENGKGGRPPYEKDNYVVFPSGQEGYIGQESDFYTLVVSNKDKNGKYARELIAVIEKILKYENFMAPQRDVLEDYEQGSLDPSPDPLPKWLKYFIASIVGFLALLTGVIILKKMNPSNSNPTARHETKEPNINIIENITINHQLVDISQGLDKTLLDIEKALVQLQSTDKKAQKLVAQQIADQAKDNPNLQSKLLEWGKSVGEASVSDVAASVIKLAISLITGLPPIP